MDLVKDKLADLHQDAKKDFMRMGKGIAKSIFRPIQPADFEKVYLPISAKQGELIRQLIVKNDCKNIVEFGTSFGISTIYLADAAKHTGGIVTSTEILESKAKIALNNIAEVGLDDYVEIKVGNAMDTLKMYQKPIDFLFLDGWKDLYLPLLQTLEPLFHSGTLIYADNMDMSETRDYSDYVLDKKHSSETKLSNNKTASITHIL